MAPTGGIQGCMRDVQVWSLGYTAPSKTTVLLLEGFNGSMLASGSVVRTHAKNDKHSSRSNVRNEDLSH